MLPELSDHYRFLAPDIPGFGESPFPDRPVQLNHVAGQILDWIDQLGISEFVVIGHSMGGYIALSMARQNPDRCIGVGLFHSTAAADSPEKKVNRTKSAEFILNHGKEAFFKTFIPGLYYQGGPWEEQIKKIIYATSKEAVIAYTRAMRDRADYQSFLKIFQGKTLFIAGERDSFISLVDMKGQAAIAVDSIFNELPDAGHLGMMEAPVQSAGFINQFLESVSFASAHS